MEKKITKLKIQEERIILLMEKGIVRSSELWIYDQIMTSTEHTYTGKVINKFINSGKVIKMRVSYFKKLLPNHEYSTLNGNCVLYLKSNYIRKYKITKVLESE